MIELDYILLVSYLIEGSRCVKFEACQGVFRILFCRALFLGGCHTLFSVCSAQACCIEALSGSCLLLALLAEGIADNLLVSNFVFNLFLDFLV